MMDELTKDQVYELYQKNMVAILPMPIGEMAYSIYFTCESYPTHYLEFYIDREPFRPEMLAYWHRTGIDAHTIGWFESEDAAITAIHEKYKPDAFLGIKITKEY